MAALAMNFQTLLPLYARNTLGLGADGYGVLYAAMGVGSLIGSLSLAFMGSHRPMLRLILAGGAVFVVAEVLLGFTRSALPAYAVIMVVGFASMLMVNTINVTIQNTVTDELRGRVMSLYVMVFAGSAPIGGFFAGAIAEVWDAPAAFILGGALGAGVLALVAWQLLGHNAARHAARAAEARAALPEADEPHPPAAAGA
jgi:MFS family permease